jgi:cellulose synthase/poly-beta-1,6-N-acetylglucosamine synthase-like glycosyltransferase
VDFAVRQVARQRDIQLELVLVTHGFKLSTDSIAKVREHVADAVVTHADSDMIFGEVLNHAVEHSSGDLVVKMDDDDWYGPNFLADLVLARHYSSADLVGCPAEFMFIEPLWITTRRPDRTEVYGDFVAGGTIMMARADLKALGGFRRLRRSVDAGLLSNVRQSGGSVFRAHGLSYLLRRGAAGHTWDPGLPYFISRSRISDQWRGFRPASLLEAEDRDRPARPEMERTA